MRSVPDGSLPRLSNCSISHWQKEGEKTSGIPRIGGCSFAGEGTGGHGGDFGYGAFGDRGVAGPEHCADLLIGPEDEAYQLAAGAEPSRDFLVGVGQEKNPRVVLGGDFLHQGYRVGTDREQMCAGLQHGGCGAEHRLQLAQRARVLLGRIQRDKQRPAAGLVVQIDDDVALIGQEEIRRAVAPFEQVFKPGCAHAPDAPDDRFAFVTLSTVLPVRPRVQAVFSCSRAMSYPREDATL